MNAQTEILHRDDCKPEHMSAPDDEGIRDCLNCGLFEYPEPWFVKRSRKRIEEGHATRADHELVAYADRAAGMAFARRYSA